MPYSLSTLSAAPLSSVPSPSPLLAMAKAVLTGIGQEDLQSSLYVAEQAYQAQRQPLLDALRSYQEAPDKVGHQERLAVLLAESIKELEIEIRYLQRQQEKQEREAALGPARMASSSYLSQAKSWALVQVKCFFGSTAAQQAAKYRELVEDREALLRASEALWAELKAPAQTGAAPRGFRPPQGALVEGSQRDREGPLPVQAAARRLLGHSSW